jgi:CubicO group peptidase (beta-lactamase class C family)
MRVWVLAALAASFVITFAVSGLNPFRKTVERNAPLDEFTAHLDERIPALMKLYGIPGSSLALVKDGRIVWSGAYGYADLAAGRMLTTDTPMRVQSISKSVTAWGVMRLAEEGRIDLDSPVSGYLKNWQFPASAYFTEKVTVRQLLSHTAGLPLGDVFTIYSPEEAMPSLEEKLTLEAVLTAGPGSAFSYSNTGYNLLELLIEKVSGQDFAGYMEEEVLQPLGMAHSTFAWRDTLAPAVPTGYDLRGKAVPVYVYPEKGSGGLFAAAEDIAAFAIAGMSAFHDGKQTLSTQNLDALYTPHSSRLGVYSLVFDAYGLGHYLETLPNGQQAVSHGGQGSGIMTHFHTVPESGDAIVILTNSQRSWPFIAYILSDWARWRGFPSVGMGRIIWGKYGLWVGIGLVWSAVLLAALRPAVWYMGLTGKTRPGKGPFRLSRVARAGLSVAILGGLAWCLCQKYLFLTAVFPRASLWLGISVFALAIVLLLSTLIPEGVKQNKEKENG